MAGLTGVFYFLYEVSTWEKFIGEKNDETETSENRKQMENTVMGLEKQEWRQWMKVINKWMVTLQLLLTSLCSWKM